MVRKIVGFTLGTSKRARKQKLEMYSGKHGGFILYLAGGLAWLVLFLILLFLASEIYARDWIRSALFFFLGLLCWRTFYRLEVRNGSIEAQRQALVKWNKENLDKIEEEAHGKSKA